MNWITDRPPTVEDADRHGYVWADEDGVVVAVIWDAFDFDDFQAWQPKYLPEPYTPPKPERPTQSDVHGKVTWIKVLPGDPPDWDVLLEAVDHLLAVHSDILKGLPELRKARVE